MSKYSSFLIKLFKILNTKYNYSILRGYEELPINFKSHDIDILIEKKDFILLKHELINLLESSNFKLLMVNENERFNTFIIAKREENLLEFLYLDFFFNYSLYGVHLLDASTILQRKVFNGKIYHVNIVDEFLEKFLNTSLLNSSYPKKYHHILDEIKKNHHQEIQTTLVNIFNDKTITIEKVQKTSGKKLLKKVFLKNILNSPIKQIKLSSQFIYFYIKGRIKPNGFSLTITGPDGSGKTTILNYVEEIFLKIYREVEIHHFRPTVIPRIAELFNKAGLKKEVDVNYDKPHRGAKTGTISSWVRLLYYISDYIIGYYKVVKPVLFRRGIVIFDRYYTDIISDSKRSRIYINYKTIFNFRKIVPKLDYNFIIFVEPNKILERKQELTTKQINEIYEKLNFICNKDRRYIKIDNNQTPDIAINSILDYILEAQHEKLQKFFK